MKPQRCKKMLLDREANFATVLVMSALVLLSRASVAEESWLDGFDPIPLNTSGDSEGQSIFQIWPGLANNLETNNLETYNLETQQGSFQQQKQVPILQRAIESTGEFYYKPEKGLYWHLLTPIVKTNLFSNAGLSELEWRDDGTLAIKTKASGQIISDIMLAIFQQNEQRLTKHFRLHKNSGEQQCLALTPQQQAWETILQGIQICGTTRPTEIIFFEAHDVRTRLELNYTDFNELSEEAKRFAQH
ncbi:hypothetical protein OLMES_1025 [Oleiphilus messinensis]|uniref:Outer membrane lipoprotein carrier protein LolA n=1 Tax=Oleiphilus messinensis TaxID=141451 RepID=A0A1Y0I3W9_9GAMM|nr:hypothetical protein [Oleiphilus messinensis]ARU55111.1 hypothetical protein OLMES_1025 [Oleiphilus messinensis]